MNIFNNCNTTTTTTAIDPNTTTTTATNSYIINPTISNTIPYTVTFDAKAYKFQEDQFFRALKTATHPEYAYTFEHVKEIVPERVYQFTFKDGKKIKTVREENDSFDFEYMFYLAIAKTMYSKDYTFEGVLEKSYQLQYTKKYAKAVKDGIRLFKKLKEEEEKKKELEAIKKRQHTKYVNKKKEAKLRKEDKQVKLIAKAIKMAK